MGVGGVVLRLEDRKPASHLFTLSPQGKGEPPPPQVWQSLRDLCPLRMLGLFSSLNLSVFIYEMGTK